MHKRYRAAGRYPGWRKQRAAAHAPHALAQSSIDGAARSQTELVRLLQDMAIAANESDTVPAALQFAVNRLCAFLRWPIGHALLLQEDEALKSTGIWHTDLPESFAPFRAESQALRFEKGFGLPGEVLETRSPVWVVDMANDRIFRRQAAAEQSGLNTGLAIPVLAQHAVVGVLEFFHTQQIPPDPGLLAVLPHIGVQLGRVIERQQAQESLRKSAAQLRLIITSLPLLLMVTDRQGKLIMLEGKGFTPLGIQTQAILGQSVLRLVEQRPDVRALVERSLRGEDIHTEVYATNQATYEVFFTPYNDADGAVEGVIGLAFDVSDRKRLERDLEDMKHLLLDSVESDRSRLGRQLHDGPLQDLYGAYYQVQEVQNLLGPEGRELAQRALTTLRDVNATLRVICGELHPSTLAHLGIQRAIASYTDHVLERYQTSSEIDLPVIHLDLPASDLQIAYKQRLSLFRIYQNLINNALRHAQARNVWVRLYEQDGALQLEIRDDGHGFDLPKNWVELVRAGHFGLANVIERVEGLGGSVQIQSSTGAGTRVRLQLPFSSGAAPAPMQQ